MDQKQSINDIQIGGTHYDKSGEQHWDRAWRLQYDFFQYQITKYVERWKKKNGLEDLKKAQHFLNKYVELVEGQDMSAKGTPSPEQFADHVAKQIAIAQERKGMMIETMSSAELRAAEERRIDSLGPPRRIPDRF